MNKGVNMGIGVKHISGLVTEETDPDTNKPKAISKRDGCSLLHQGGWRSQRAKVARADSVDSPEQR